MATLRVCRFCGKNPVQARLKACSVACRFWSHVDRSGGPDACWVWTGALDACGYGSFGHRESGAHRFAWVLAHGPIPVGAFIMHTCDVRYPRHETVYRQCVNPAHLQAGTHAENMAHMARVGRTNPAVGARNGRHTKPGSTLRGERHGMARVTADDVRGIRTSAESNEGLGRRYGITASAIRLIKNRKNWSHIP